MNLVLPALFILSLATSLGCSHGKCNNLPQRPTSEEHSKNIQNTQAEVTQGAQVPREETFITIFKDSGEKQCQPKSQIPISKMKTQLESAKIPVLEYKTQNDGQMHIQVCGSTTGELHTFLIEKKYLPKAKKLGYGVWNK
ncbi:MAG: hypothetical protein IPM57_06145 [Oligoflexia bacterium]|nr:hypothetical protein [Oligoflexia bacterium]